jgi:hypothetical protein
MMRSALETQRQRVVRELRRVNRQITATEKRLLQIAARLEILAQTSVRAA